MTTFDGQPVVDGDIYGEIHFCRRRRSVRPHQRPKTTPSSTTASTASAPSPAGATATSTTTASSTATTTPSSTTPSTPRAPPALRGYFREPCRGNRIILIIRSRTHESVPLNRGRRRSIQPCSKTALTIGLGLLRSGDPRLNERIAAFTGSLLALVQREHCHARWSRLENASHPNPHDTLRN